VVVFAHTGHRTVQILYLAPLIALAVAFLIGRIKERGKRRASEAHER